MSTKKPAFRLVPNPTFKFEAEIPMAGETPQVLKLIGKHKGKKAMQELQAKMTDSEVPPTDVEVLMDILGGWEDVDGEFNAENLEQLVDAYPKAAATIYAAYAVALVDGKEKN